MNWAWYTDGESKHLGYWMVRQSSVLSFLSNYGWGKSYLLHSIPTHDNATEWRAAVIKCFLWQMVHHWMVQVLITYAWMSSRALCMCVDCIIIWGFAYGNENCNIYSPSIWREAPVDGWAFEVTYSNVWGATSAIQFLCAKYDFTQLSDFTNHQMI